MTHLVLRGNSFDQYDALAKPGQRALRVNLSLGYIIRRVEEVFGESLQQSSRRGVGCKNGDQTRGRSDHRKQVFGRRGFNNLDISSVTYMTHLQNFGRQVAGRAITVYNAMSKGHKMRFRCGPKPFLQVSVHIVRTYHDGRLRDRDARKCSKIRTFAFLDEIFVLKTANESLHH
jgi:hypothetical protein